MIDGFRRIEPDEHEALVSKCQHNGWLMYGGYDWQDDPYLEEYPYEFARTDDVEALRSALGHGNWAIRQGFLYEDLAFIQQVNGGDEWWTLKLADGKWHDFESWSFQRIAKDPAEFADAISHMHHATLEECLRLEYMRSEIPGKAERLADRADAARSSSAARTACTQIPQMTEDRVR